MFNRNHTVHSIYSISLKKGALFKRSPPPTFLMLPRPMGARKRKLRPLTHQTKRLMRTKHQEFLAKIKSSFSVNPKLFCSYHKAILHHRGTTHHEITFNGVNAESAQDKATLFNEYFSSVFRPPSTYPSSSTCDQPDHLNLKSFLIWQSVLKRLHKVCTTLTHPKHVAPMAFQLVS